jgi:hypothetical protein
MPLRVEHYWSRRPNQILQEIAVPGVEQPGYEMKLIWHLPLIYVPQLQRVDRFEPLLLAMPQSEIRS